MDIELVIERVQRVAAARASDDVAAIKAGLRSVTQLRGWLAASEAALTAALKPQVSFPEKDVADCTRTSLGEATKATERSETLAAVPEFADALDAGAVTQGHVDEITKHTKGLNDAQRAELLERAAALVPVAVAGSVREFGKRLDLERRAVERGDGLDKLARQRRKVEFRDWIDGDGMYCYGGRLDPHAAIAFKANLEAQIRRQFAAGTPDTAPDDPLLRQRHLAGLALAHLVGRPTGSTDGDEHDSGARTSPIEPDVIIVVDASQSDGAGGPDIDWGIPVEVPLRVLADLIADGHATVHAVVVRNGIVLHAPGNLNLGRTARLANRAQRRALNALYSTCAIPGCGVHFRYTKVHHIEYWEAGGRTDLANLLPVCPHHHTLVHQQRWHITLGPNRELTIRYPDGGIQTTGPPSRRNAA